MDPSDVPGFAVNGKSDYLVFDEVYPPREDAALRPFLREALRDMTKKEGTMNPVDSAKFNAKVRYALSLAEAGQGIVFESHPEAVALLREAAASLCEAIRLAGGPVVELVIAPEDPLANPRLGAIAIVPGLPADPTLDMITARTPEVVTVQDPPTG